MAAFAFLETCIEAAGEVKAEREQRGQAQAGQVLYVAFLGHANLKLEQIREPRQKLAKKGRLHPWHLISQSELLELAEFA